MTLLLVLIVVALALTTLKTRFPTATAVTEVMLTSLVMPVQDVLAGGMQRMQELWFGYVQLTRVQAQNVHLQQRVEALEDQLHQYREAYLQYQRLRELLAFRELSFPASTPAEVVGIDPSPWAAAITANKGSEHGIEKNRAVITYQGLVGHTIGTTPGYATVLLITDRRSSVDAIVQRSRAHGIVVGKSQRLVAMHYVDVQEDIRIGDKIISSGLGKLYPKGLMIGTVKSLRPQRHGLFYEIEVQPAVDFTKLEEVLVLDP